MSSETIAAIATAPGRGGVGIVRVSGPKSREIADKLLGFTPTPRTAIYTPFRDIQGRRIDQGVAIFFISPNSFTGEDVLEFQGHGGPVIMDLLLESTIQAGARLAKPGEFSERAFLNDKIDLAQAEAIADLIAANSRQAALSAMNSLQGGFSKQINTLVQDLTDLRIYVESAIDFPEEEIDFLGDGVVSQKLNEILEHCQKVTAQAKQGTLISEGMKVVIAGKPNAGKSSLLNTLAQREAAIVTDIAGTTRDILKEHIHIDGMPLHIIDTAGIHSQPDEVEKIGIARAQIAMGEADRILLLIDASTDGFIPKKALWEQIGGEPKLLDKVSLIYNKIDKLSDENQQNGYKNPELSISAKSGDGIDKLKVHLKQVMGFKNTTEGQFSARRRHLDAIKRADECIKRGKKQLDSLSAGELLAEDLREAQNELAEITGKITPDELLGKIFSSFCIGK